MKKLLPLIIVAVVIAIIWKQSPTLRSMFSDAKEKVTGWSEEQIKKDPVAFLNHAEKQIKNNLSGLKESKGKIESDMAELRKKRDENQATVDLATDLTGKFKTAYKDAKANNTWPVTVADDQYNEEQLFTQVEKLIFEKNSLSALIESQTAALEKADQASSKLGDKITQLNGELQSIAAKRETVNADKLTAEADEWLAKINKQMAEAGEIANMGDNPIRDLKTFRDVEEAKKKKEAEAAAEAEKEAATRAFLES